MAGTIRSSVGDRQRTPQGRLNGVRPRWPEQFVCLEAILSRGEVSMESGLDGRNNASRAPVPPQRAESLNGVRPRWPEQCQPVSVQAEPSFGVSMESGLDGRNNPP